MKTVGDYQKRKSVQLSNIAKSKEASTMRNKMWTQKAKALFESQPVFCMIQIHACIILSHFQTIYFIVFYPFLKQQQAILFHQ